MFRGVPASGKSTFIKNNHLEPYTLSSDTFRLLLRSPAYNIHGKISIPQEISSRAFKLMYQVLEERMKHGELTIIDATNTRRKDIMEYKKYCEKYGYYIRVVDFLTTTTKEECIQRNRHRESFRQVPEEIIHRMYKRCMSESEKLPNSIKIITPNQMMEEINQNLQFNDLSDYKEIKIIGDIHGCYDTLYNMIPKFEDDTFYIFLGDYFDRGPKKKEVLDLLISIRDKKNVVLLYGNHEWNIRNWLIDDKTTKETERTIEILFNSKKEVRQFLRYLVPVYGFSFCGLSKIFMCHGGLPTPNVIQSYRKISTHDFIYGTGVYDDVDIVNQSWYEHSNPKEMLYQIHGHRHGEKVNPYSRSLDGSPSSMGKIYVMTVHKDGKIQVDSKDTQYMFHHSILTENDMFHMNNDDYIRTYRQCDQIKERKMPNQISSFNFTKNAFFKKEWNPVTVRARGMFVDTDTTEVVARSYDKFFVFKEMDVSSPDYILKNYGPVIRLEEKTDGYLCIMGYDTRLERLIFTSKSMISNAMGADYAKHFRDMIIPEITDMNRLVADYLSQGKCLVFECVDSEFDPHLITYPNKQIVLLDILDRSFTYTAYPFLRDKVLHNCFNRKNGIVRVVRHLDTMQTKDFLIELDKNECMNIIDSDYLKSISEQYLKDNRYRLEGLVCKDANGHMFKWKTPYYRMMKWGRNTFFNIINSDTIQDERGYLLSGPSNLLPTNRKHMLEYIHFLQLQKKYIDRHHLEEEFYNNPFGLQLLSDMFNYLY